jgi:hypothetical protein
VIGDTEEECQIGIDRLISSGEPLSTDHFVCRLIVSPTDIRDSCGGTIMADEPFGVADSSGLTDADWVNINGLRRAYKTNGKEALSAALGKLAKEDPIRYVRVIGAFFPETMREAIRDEMTERGMT